MKQIIAATLFLAVILMVHGCANRVIPTGGEKDILPPVLLNATPGNYQANFTATKIVLTFDEYVQLKDVQKQVMISPPMSPPPQIEIRKKSIVVTFRDSLKSNTTYTMNFGNAIADFTEANSLTGFEYVFTTGSILDSLIIAGVMKDARTLKTMKAALALLYDSEVPDSAIGITPPLYYARTNDDGTFKIHNVKEGAYRLVGLDDKNGNFTAEFADESIGVGTDIILLRDSAFMIAYLSMQIPSKQSIKNTFREVPGKLTTGFARPYGEISWKFLSTQPEKVIPQYNSNRDTVILYCFPEASDSVELVWYNEQGVIDTIMYRGEKPKTQAKIAATKKLSGTVYPQNGAMLTPETLPSIQWAAPLKSFDLTMLKLVHDSAEVPVHSEFVDSLQTKINFSAQWLEGKYEILLPAGIAEDLYGRTNDTIIITLTIPNERASGSIAYVFLPSTGAEMLLQLVNDKDELIRQRKISGKQKGSFEQVDPGQYYLRAVYDSNSNGRWDAGEIRKRIPPEKMIYYRDPVTVRANWEVEVDWTE